MKESSDTEYKGMGRGNNPPLSATLVYPSESDKKDEVGSYSCVRSGVPGKHQTRE